MSKIFCGACRHYFSNRHGGVCTLVSSVMCDDDVACDNFEKPTLFDRITASPEVLAPKLVYRSFIRRTEIRGNGLFLEVVPIKIKCYKSKVIPGVHYKNSTEAIAATVEKLKEVCNETTSN